jgi:hemin uptake protein HemP
MLPELEVTDLTKIKTAPVLPRKISSEALLGTGRELVIVHKGKEYRLRLTQLGKLILTA